MNKDLREELQRVMVEAESYKRQLETIASQRTILEEARLEMGQTIEAIEQVSKAEVGDELLVPLGSGSYVRAELKENKKLVLGIGANVSMEESFDEAKKVIHDRRIKITEDGRKLQEISDSIAEKNNKLNQRYEMLVKQIQERSGE
ncbi:MAG: prefoldin subunit alpha [Candidatus Altiarchaeales archaeon ex4484_2]|nr:MAG: prefoldin subunit alpha [Candidatus Altiarchaeales archaeon ex4484_2]